MAGVKEIAGGLVVIAILYSVSAPDKEPPPPPPMCDVPIAGGSTMAVEVTSIPCPEMVRQANQAIEEADRLAQKVPTLATVVNDSANPDPDPDTPQPDHAFDALGKNELANVPAAELGEPTQVKE